jgi:uncharacterized protein (TIGR00369 family)
VSWQDPAELAAAARRSSGIEFMAAIRDGDIPPAPMQELLGFSLDEVGDGRVVFSAVPGELHYNPIGVVHGGVAATLLDSAMGAAVHTTMAAGEGYTTLETKCNFVRAITAATGRVLAEGRVVHRGGRIATAEARLTAERDGKLLAHGTSTCLLSTSPGPGARQ